MNGDNKFISKRNKKILDNKYKWATSGGRHYQGFSSKEKMTAYFSRKAELQNYTLIWRDDLLSQSDLETFEHENFETELEGYYLGGYSCTRVAERRYYRIKDKSLIESVIALRNEIRTAQSKIQKLLHKRHRKRIREICKEFEINTTYIDDSRILTVRRAIFNLRLNLKAEVAQLINTTENNYNKTIAQSVYIVDEDGQRIKVRNIQFYINFDDDNTNNSIERVIFPTEVLGAFENGKTVLRQGDVYFVEIDFLHLVDNRMSMFELHKIDIGRHQFMVDNNNIAQGEVTHPQHKTLQLDRNYRFYTADAD